uniref:Uncharacterized protein n=1 Tax=Capsaspora owczarzaki TaxID=192875 RepID=M1JZI2_9EUKA|nr:hypothetical protein [Capsaspora owczarzaki]
MRHAHREYMGDGIYSTHMVWPSTTRIFDPSCGGFGIFGKWYILYWNIWAMVYTRHTWCGRPQLGSLILVVEDLEYMDDGIYYIGIYYINVLSWNIGNGLYYIGILAMVYTILEYTILMY